MGHLFNIVHCSNKRLSQNLYKRVITAPYKYRCFLLYRDSRDWQGEGSRGRRGWEHWKKKKSTYDNTKQLGQQELFITIAHIPLLTSPPHSANSPIILMLFLHPIRTLKLPFPWLWVWQSWNPKMISSVYINILANPEIIVKKKSQNTSTRSICWTMYLSNCAVPQVKVSRN